MKASVETLDGVCGWEGSSCLYHVEMRMKSINYYVTHSNEHIFKSEKMFSVDQRSY